MKQRLLNWALRKLFPVFNLDNVLTSNKAGQLFLNGQLVKDERLNALKAQVRQIKNTDLWKVMTETLMYDAQQVMFNRSTNLQDLMNGKMICYTIDIQQKMIDKIDKAK